MATTRYVGDPNLSFEQLLAQGPSSLAEWCRAHGLPLEVFLTPSRNAGAHEDWSLENDVVTLCPLKPPKGGPVPLRVAELVDHAIQLAEVSLAMFWGVLLGVHEVGAVLPDIEEPYGQRWTHYVEWLLLAGGWSSAVCSETDGGVDLSGVVRRPVRWIELFSALAYVPPDCGSVSARIETPAGVRLVTVPAGLVHKQRRQGGDDALLWLAAFMHRCTVNDQPALSPTGLRTLLATVALKATTDVDHVRGINTLRGVRASATDAGDSALARLAARAQGWKVSVANKESRDAEELRDLIGWTAAKVVSPEYI